MSRLRPPADAALDAATWTARHRVLTRVLLVQAIALAVWALSMHPPGHALLDLAGIPVAATVAALATGRPRLCACAMAVGLFTESALAVHLSGGAVSVHLHFFVMLCLLALYEDVLPLAAGVLYVVVQHGLMGSMAPGAVFGDGPEAAHPWAWAGLHGALVITAAGALSATWRANAAARAKERQGRREAEEFLDIAGTMIVALDADDRIVVANRRTCQVLGRQEDELLGRRYADVIATPREAGRHLDRLAARLDSPLGDPQDSESRVRTADGRERLVKWQIVVRFDGEGRPVGTLASGEDVTEQRRAQAQLARDRADLALLRRLAQDVASQDDARQSVVERVSALVDADVAMLVEPLPGHRGLEVTTATTPALVGLAVDRAEPAATWRAFDGAELIFRRDLTNPEVANPRLVATAGVRSAAFVPVVVRGRAAGVLVVGWRSPVDELDPRRADLVGLAANEAASALQRLATVRHLEAAALTDPLTGIANRRCFDHELPRALARARRSGEPLSVAMLDLNRFKALNDAQGHEAGDRLLRAVAHAWLDALRGTDLLARIGGDEFAVLLPGCSAADHGAVAARLRAACPHDAGCGLGLALWDGREDRDALLRRADRAMYADKTSAGTVQSGRGSATVRPT